MKSGEKSFTFLIFSLCLDFNTHDNSKAESRRKFVAEQTFLYSKKQRSDSILNFLPSELPFPKFRKSENNRIKFFPAGCTEVLISYQNFQILFADSYLEMSFFCLSCYEMYGMWGKTFFKHDFLSVRYDTHDNKLTEEVLFGVKMFFISKNLRLSSFTIARSNLQKIRKKTRIFKELSNSYS